MWTKRHMDRVAAMFKSCDWNDNEEREMFLESWVDEFKKNPRFNEKKFKEACGCDRWVDIGDFGKFHKPSFPIKKESFTWKIGEESLLDAVDKCRDREKG